MLSVQKLWKKVVLLSVEGQLAKAILAQICMGVFFYSFIVFAILFLPKSPADRR
jgi:hypothetical protein